MFKLLKGEGGWECPYCNQLNALGDNYDRGCLTFDQHRHRNSGFIIPEKVYNKYQKPLKLQIVYVVCLNPQ